MNHSTKTSYGQCRCRWCGAYGGGSGCPVTAEMRAAVCNWAAAEGRTWKSQLVKMWDNPAPEAERGPVHVLLLQFRDILDSKMRRAGILAGLSPGFIERSRELLRKESRCARSLAARRAKEASGA